MRVITREKQALAKMEARFNERELKQDELFDLIERKRALLAELGHPVE